MTKIRIAHISYLNSVPYYAGMSSQRLEMIELHPRALGQAAAAGEIDAGLMSVADTFRSPEFEPLADLGIALESAAHSVLLFSAVPVRELEGTTIGITEETSTSFPLLRLVLDGHYGVSPAAFVRRPRGPEPSDAGMLLIGDAALRRAAAAGLEPGRRDYGEAELELSGPELTRPELTGPEFTGEFTGPEFTRSKFTDKDPLEEPYRHVLDLAAAWRQWQDLPFVFARWMVRRGLEDDARAELIELLLETLERNLRRLHTLAAEQAARVGLSDEGAYAYLMGFTYQFGPEGEQAIGLFRELLESSLWWETARPAVLDTEGQEAAE